MSLTVAELDANGAIFVDFWGAAPFASTTAGTFTSAENSIVVTVTSTEGLLPTAPTVPAGWILDSGASAMFLTLRFPLTGNYITAPQVSIRLTGPASPNTFSADATITGVAALTKNGFPMIYTG